MAAPGHVAPASTTAGLDTELPGRIRRLRLHGGLPEQLDEQIDGLRLSTVGRGRGGQARASRQEPAYGAGRRPNVGTRSGALYGA